LEKRVQRKREIFALYSELLKDCAEFMPEIPNSRGNRWLTTLLFKEKNAHLRVIDALNRADIESRPLWKPMHLQPVFKGALSVTDGTSEDYFSRGICLPSGSDLDDANVEKVAKIVRESL
ncbi:MAG: DegT/DnrJ/EryC1/StrS family aminotransferase, partial [Campylobacter sp.]|nr:DegT/DnrJ/EryC1/StrS family aminotransferase [Campylobacter sp.]